MQSSNDARSRISVGDIPYGLKNNLSQFKDANSLNGGLSDATSINDYMQDGQSVYSNDVLQTPSSMRGSAHNLSTN